MNIMTDQGNRGTGLAHEIGINDLELDFRGGVVSGGEPRHTEYTGTKALMLAVLEDGIRSYLSPVGRVRSEAEYWVSARRERSPFSFTVVCETLGLEPDAVRQALERMRSKDVTPRRALRRSRPNVRRGSRLAERRKSS